MAHLPPGFDPRETPFNGRVAHVSLKGKLDAETFVEGEWRPVNASVADILVAPTGARTRQLVHGERFCVIDLLDGMVYGFAERDGYCGWIEASAFIAADTAHSRTHFIAVPRTNGLSRADVKCTQREFPISFGARFALLAIDGDWARAPIGRGTIPRDIHLPRRVLKPIDENFSDPAAVAELFLHTPYLWGGNTAFGIDCSGLIQAALLACGVPCPGDSDQQEARVGTALVPDTPLKRSDLVFWKGHVAMALDAKTIIHANAHHMAVAIEPLATARARIQAAGGGPVTATRRP